MKGFFKFTTAALALVAMASCSNDEFLTNGQAAADGEVEGALQIEMEDLIDDVTSTRAAYVPNGAANQLWWNDKDEIIVKDETLLQQDKYQFSENRGTFENIDTKNHVKTPVYAFTNLTRTTLSYSKWDSDKDQVVARYWISTYPLAGVDKNIASTKGNKVKAYRFSLPMWGDAAAEGKGVKVSLRYLTGVLRVDMKQLPAEYAFIRISGYTDQACHTPAPMTGPFEAVVAEEDEVDEKASLKRLTPKQLDDEYADQDWYINNTANVMYVNLNDMDPDELDDIRVNGGYIYIPLIAQNYGALLFEYSADGITYKTLKKTKPVSVERGKVYRMIVSEFDIAGADAESLNALLEEKKDETEPVIVNTTYPTEMKGNGKNVVKIPAGFKAESLTLDLTGITSDGSLPFEIESADGKYTGDVVLDLGNGTVTALPAIYMNLPKSNVTIKGNYNGADLGNYDQNKFIVNSLTIAPISQDEKEKGYKPTLVGDIYPNYESFTGGAEPGIYVMENTTVDGDIDLEKPNENLDGCIGNTSIKIEGAVTGDIYAAVFNPEYKLVPFSDRKLAKMYSSIPVTVSKKGSVGGMLQTAADITISGEAVVDHANTWFGNITISDKAKSTTWLEAENREKDGNGGKVTMSGDTKAVKIDAVEVALSEQAEVSGNIGDATAPELATLSITGTAKAKSNVTMKAEGTATINLSEEGEAIGGKFTVVNTAITLTQGYIKEIVKNAAAGKKTELTFGEGEGFTAIGSFSGTGDFEFKNASTWNGKNIADKFKPTYTGNYIYTAVQLASNPYSAAWVALGNDVDLNNEAWTPLKLQTSFSGDGTGKTIKNLKVTGADDKGTGLFASSEGTGAIIGGLTIDGAEISAAGKTNVGVIAGIANAAVVIKNVTIKNATVTGKYNVGGLIGNSKAIAITNADVAGITFANPDAKKSEPTLSAEQDKKAGSFGRYVGYLGGDFKADKDAAGTLDMKDLGFWANLKKNGGKGYFYYPGTVNCGLFNTAITSYQVGSTSIPGSNIYSDTYTADPDLSLKADKAAAAGKLGCFVVAAKWIE